MAYINTLATVLPAFRISQDQLLEMGRRLLKGKVPFLDNVLGLFTNAGVEERFLVREPNVILDNDNLGWRNRVFGEASIELGCQLVEDLLARSGLDARDIDMIITTSCTGFMIPSVDAHLINHFRMRPDIKRLPITELGCAGGAMALSRAADFLQARPDQVVMVLALEFPSLTYRTRDFRPANLVSVALFGDGGAGAILSTRPSACRILQSRAHFFYDTPDMMGFDLNELGFKIILDKKISELVRTQFRAPLERFLQDQKLQLSDMHHYVLHPGGRRIMDNLESSLGLREQDIAASRSVLRQVGNLSSASVYWVLKEVLNNEPEGLGLMAAFGPGFNAEMLTLNFTRV